MALCNNCLRAQESRRRKQERRVEVARQIARQLLRQMPEDLAELLNEEPDQMEGQIVRFGMPPRNYLLGLRDELHAFMTIANRRIKELFVDHHVTLLVRT